MTTAPMTRMPGYLLALAWRAGGTASGPGAAKPKLGGRAHWGDTAMPLPAERGGPLSSEDAHTLIRWVMSQ